MFNHIKKVLPATVLYGTGSQVKSTKTYWTAGFGITDERESTEIVNDLQVMLWDSVHLQMRSDVPVGAYLSGGLDSSVTAALASRCSLEGLPAFHGAFPGYAGFDESYFARKVADEIGSSLFEVFPQPEDFVTLLPDLIFALDEPVAGPGSFPQFLVSKLARDHVKVVLGGQGGDEVFGGYARYLVAYLEQALKGAIFQSSDESQHIMTLASITPNLPLLQEYVPMIQSLFGEGLFDAMHLRYFRLLDRSMAMQGLLKPEWVEDKVESIERFRSIFESSGSSSYINKMLHFDLQTQLPALLQVEDRVSMTFGLESRLPLLDHRIVSLGAQAPPAMKFRDGKTKHLLSEAAAHIVPAVVRERRDKMGFPVPLSEWIKENPVRDFVRDVISGPSSAGRGIFEASHVASSLDRNNLSTRQVWGLLSLELWFQEYFGSR